MNKQDLRIKQLEDIVKAMQEQAMNSNKESATAYAAAYAGLDIVEKIKTVSPDEYTARMSELEASNQQKLAQEPSIKYDDKGKIIGYNTKKIFAKPNGYESRAYMLVGDNSTKYILDTNEVLRIDMNRLDSGFLIKGIEVEGKKISNITIDVRDLPMYRQPQTVEEANEVVRLKLELGYL